MNFCTRLSRADLGPLRDEGETGGIGRASLQPRHPADVAMAFSLCEEANVSIALAGLEAGWVASSASLLTLDPSLLDDCRELGGGAWQVQAGCRVGRLARSGLAQFDSADPDQCVAAWLAGQGGHWPPGELAGTGLAAVTVRLGDRTVETLGPFGTDDTQPLRSATVQRLVPALFDLTASKQARQCRARSQWPARYRLDALLPAPSEAVNLAHLLCGHGGTLAWVQAAVFTPGGPAPCPPVETQSRPPPADDADAAQSAFWLDRRVKDLFDPAERLAPFA